MQTIKTSRKQVPAIFKKGRWVPGFRNLDLGAGRFPELFTEALESVGVENHPYDPGYSPISEMPEGRFDTATISNVLNVIDTWHGRMSLISEAIKRAPVVYITVYEGDRSGEGRETRDGYQMNQSLRFYYYEIGKYFPEVHREMKNGVLTLRVTHMYIIREEE